MKRYTERDFALFRPSILPHRQNNTSPGNQTIFSTRFPSRTLDLRLRRSSEISDILPKLELLIAHTDHLGVGSPLHTKHMFDEFHTSPTHYSSPKNYKEYVNTHKNRKNTDATDGERFNLKIERIHANTVFLCKTIGADNQQLEFPRKKLTLPIQVHKELPRIEGVTDKRFFNTTLTGQKKELQMKIGASIEVPKTFRKSSNQKILKESLRRRDKKKYSILDPEELAPWEMDEGV